jgi:hypothetical protein
MSTELKYMPIFRARQEENKVLKSFDFGNSIYPCIEIYKELLRKPSTPKKNTKTPPKKRKVKTFEDDYLPLINKVNAKQVFVDFPIHLISREQMDADVIRFIRGVILKRENRTAYMKKFAMLSHKVIPVISTYAEVTGERQSILIQETDLRPFFGAIAFRTFPKTFSRDIAQIKAISKPEDYVIMDLEEMELDLDDGDLLDIADELESLNCNVIIHRNAVSKGITNKGLAHNDVVRDIDNSLINKFHLLKGSCFSDYAGIKKDDVTKGGGISPGFIFYDAVGNRFYGFRYREGHRKLDEFETTIVPAIVGSEASRRMDEAELDYLGFDNIGWGIIKKIELEGEPGKSPAKFKRIGMEHYIHCINCRVVNGDFD